MRAIALVCVAALATTACLRKTEFQCSDDSACGGGGQCESTGFCSFADAECATGRRYDSSAGALADRCTGGTTTDGGTGDSAMPDTPSGNGCPAGYVDLPGAPGHKYMLVTDEANWAAQQQQCQLTAAYLAIPDTLQELIAMDALATSERYWVGVTDSAAEGTWLTVKSTAQTFLPWQPPAPDNDAGGPGEDCVEVLAATHTFNDQRCNRSRTAICECEP